MQYLEGKELGVHCLFQVILLCGIKGPLDADKLRVGMGKEVIYSGIVQLIIHGDVGLVGVASVAKNTWLASNCGCSSSL